MALVDKKVVVSSVYQVKGVNVSTGNISYDGSIEIAGNVDENFEVKAGGMLVYIKRILDYGILPLNRLLAPGYQYALAA